MHAVKKTQHSESVPQHCESFLNKVLHNQDLFFTILYIESFSLLPFMNKFVRRLDNYSMARANPCSLAEVLFLFLGKGSVARSCPHQGGFVEVAVNDERRGLLSEIACEMQGCRCLAYSTFETTDSNNHVRIPLKSKRLGA